MICRASHRNKSVPQRFTRLRNFESDGYNLKSSTGATEKAFICKWDVYWIFYLDIIRVLHGVWTIMNYFDMNEEFLVLASQNINYWWKIYI